MHDMNIVAPRKRSFSAAVVFKLLPERATELILVHEDIRAKNSLSK